jgi:NTP pyrophosphatase (non-canonical NTP hydrolase)
MEVNRLQIRLHAWQSREFPEQKPGGDYVANLMRLGVVEECGELARALLKREQRIRGMEYDEAFESARDDAVGDVLVYYLQLCTALQQPVQPFAAVDVKPGSAPEMLTRVQRYAQEDFPSLRFNRACACLAQAAGVSAQESLRCLVDVSEHVMSRKNRTEIR